ncbi:MAG: Zn-ribbon domain-containing OB-fold protein [Betaproteobacteria bacterium]|nr:Zn-ribbon domain-containing OB-fold protein [Betaproteobacteria bacterium]
MTQTSATRTIPAPLINPENQRFFDAATQGQLLVGKCHACGEYHYYPRVLCPHCFSDRTEWVVAQGGGVVYSYSTLHRGVPAPYTLAYVTLDEGVTMLTNLVDCEAAAVHIGARVRVVFKEAEGGARVPMFTL